MPRQKYFCRGINVTFMTQMNRHKHHLTSQNMHQNKKSVQSKKCFCKIRLQNGGHPVQASMYDVTYSKSVEPLCAQSCASTLHPGLSISTHKWRTVGFPPPTSSQRTPAGNRRWERTGSDTPEGSHTGCCRRWRWRRNRGERKLGWKGSSLVLATSSHVAGCLFYFYSWKGGI